MQGASVFVDAAKRRGFSYWSGVPCSYLQPLINYVIDDAGLNYIPSTNEGDAVALACGVHLGGGRAVVMLQNSGLGNAVNPLTSLAYTHRIPLLLIVTLRGEPGLADEPQHALMGAITTDLLDLMRVKWAYFPTDPIEVEACLERIDEHFTREYLPYCLVMRKDTVAPWPLKTHTTAKARSESAIVREAGHTDVLSSRADMLAALLGSVRRRDVLFATTGYIGRELYAMQDRPNHFCLVGAMGCASSLGVGFALARSDWRAIVVDGDGALLMRMGAVATIGYLEPANFVHIVLDNGTYESTGNQATVSRAIDLAAIAAACRYRRVYDITRPETLAAIIADESHGSCFVRARIRSGCTGRLPRCSPTPAEVAQRLWQYVQSGGTP